MTHPPFTIGDLAEFFAITPRTLRFYESKGLIKPKRQGLNRVYSEKDKFCLELALRGKRIGLSLDEIKEIIEMYDPKQPDDPHQLLFLLQKLHIKRKELVNKFSDLVETLNAMDMIEARALTALSKRQNRKTAQINLELDQ